MVPQGLPTTWLGETSADRRRSFGLVGMTILLSPLLLAVKVMRKLHVPFLRGQTWSQAWKEKF